MTDVMLLRMSAHVMFVQVVVIVCVRTQETAVMTQQNKKERGFACVQVGVDVCFIGKTSEHVCITKLISIITYLVVMM